jgi:hypothetical protein
VVSQSALNVVLAFGQVDWMCGLRNTFQLSSHALGGMQVFSGHAKPAHKAMTWVRGGHVQPWRARSLP